MSPETCAVLRCVRAFLRPDDNVALRAALAQPLDWQAVECEADSHCVVPIVARAIMQNVSDLAPSEVLLRCRNHLTRIAQKNLTWLQEWQRLLQAFEEAGLQVISFKGPALALTAYGNLNLREFSDLDLLIHSRDVARGRNVLVQAGYTLWSPTVEDRDEALLLSNNRQLRFTRNAVGTAVDLHWGLLHKMFAFQIEVHQAFAAASLERYPEASFLSLSAEHLFFYLCAHGTKDCWSKLSEVCDVGVHVQAHPKIDWNNCFRLARTNRCDRLLQHALLLTDRVLKIELPAEAEGYCRQGKASFALANTAENFLFHATESRPGYWRVLKYHLAFARTWPERARLIFTRVFAPAEPDWQHVRLPRPLYFLYYLIRPLRFLRSRCHKSFVL